MSDSDDDSWQTKLEIALLSKCDYGTIRSITNLRPIPSYLRSKLWKICLNVQEDIEKNLIKKWKEDPEWSQMAKVEEDCNNLAKKLYPDDDKKEQAAAEDLKAIISFYCQTNDETYEKDNGWLEILHPVMSLELDRNQTYNLFNAILKRYIPRDCVPNGSPYHLYRLLMLYHDPEVCTLLDTKKIPPDSYAHLWFRSLFAFNAKLDVLLELWDIYFQLGDQFLAFFMSLVLVFNIKEDLLANEDKDKAELIKMVQRGPSTINSDDITDFRVLCQHFASKTPQSFRKEYKKSMFEGISLEKKASSIYQALCLPVSAEELLQANQLGTSGVRYFLIDCRPAQQYNTSHYATAFHLDANLMLENPNEFNQSVEALLDAQQQAIEAGSVAGGQHLCFMGSGHDEEDKYVNMVVANFLQRKIHYVSLALGGYEELQKCVDNPEMIVGTAANWKAKFTEDWIKKININQASEKSVFNKFSNVLKSVIPTTAHNTSSNGSTTPVATAKATEAKASPSTSSAKKPQSSNLMSNFKSNYSHLISSIPSTTTSLISSLTSAAAATTHHHQQQQTSKTAEKHVSANDKIDNLYRNRGQNMFAIDDTNDDDEGGDGDGKTGAGGADTAGSTGGAEPEFVNLKVWIDKADTLKHFKCFYREKKGKQKQEWVPGYLLLTRTHLYGLLERPNKKYGMYEIAVRHPLTTIIKIATKSSVPEILSFTYGEKIIKSSSSSKKPQLLTPSSSDETGTKLKKPDDDGDDSATTAKADENVSTDSAAEWEIKGKDWFYVPDYAGEAATAVKLQLLQIINLISQ